MGAFIDLVHILRIYLNFLAVFVVAFLLRLLVWEYYVNPLAGHSSYVPFLFPDSLNFYEYAKSLATGEGYIDAAGRMAWRMPGYSFLLAGLVKLGLNSPFWLHLPNLIIGALNAVFACILGGQIFSQRAGLFAGFILAVYPFMVFMDTLALADTLGVTAMLLFVYGARYFVNALGVRRRLISALLVGGTLAFAAYIKASFGLLLVVALPFLLIARRERRRGSPGLSWAICICGAFCALMLPWWLRNERVFNDFVPFSTMGGFTLWEASGPGADGGANHGKVAMPEAWELMQKGLTNPAGELMALDNGATVLGFPLPAGSGVLHFRANTRAELASDAYLLAAGVDYLRSLDFSFLAELTLRKFFRTWAPVPNWVGAGFWPYGLLMLLSYVPVMFFALSGLIFLRHNWREIWLLLLPAFYLSVVHAVFMGSVRYRLPAIGCLIILAAGVADYFLTEYGRKGRE